MFSNIWHRYKVMKDDAKITEMHFWMTHRGKKEAFGHFLQFGLLDRLGKSLFDGTK